MTSSRQPFQPSMVNRQDAVAPNRFSNLLKPTKSSAQKQRERPTTAASYHHSSRKSMNPQQQQLNHQQSEITMFNDLSQIGVKAPPVARRTRQERREDMSEKQDTVQGLGHLVTMEKRGGHTYEWQNAEQDKFKRQSFDRHSRIDSITAEDRDRLRRKSRDYGNQMSKVITTQNAKIDQRVVDKDAVRRHNFSQLQSEIKNEGVQRDSVVDKSGFGMENRQSEVVKNRLKNGLSSISMLPGGGTATTRMGLAAKRDASGRTSTIDEQFGGPQRTVKGRPGMQRNMSAFALGDQFSRHGADHFRKESTTQGELLKEATRSQTNFFTRQNDHQMNQNKSRGASTALNPTRYSKNTADKSIANTASSKRSYDMPLGIVKQTNTTFFSLA